MGPGVGTGAASPGFTDPLSRTYLLPRVRELGCSFWLTQSLPGAELGLIFWVSTLWARWEISTWLRVPPRSPSRPGSALPSSPVSLINVSRKSGPGIHSQHGTAAQPISQLF